MLVSTKQRKGFTVEAYTSPTEQQQRAADLRQQGKNPLTRTQAVRGGFSAQPQRRAASEMLFTVEYL